MFNSFYRLRQDPFSQTPDLRYYYPSHTHRATLDGIVQSINRGDGFVVVTGEVGCGKTILSRLVIEGSKRIADSALVLYPQLNGKELIASINDEFGIHAPNNLSLKDHLSLLTDHLIKNAKKGRKTLLMVDEAQHLSLEALETIRLLSNIEGGKTKLLHIILFGQNEFSQKLLLSEVRQLKQRISKELTITPLSSNEVGLYIQHRVERAGGGNFLRFEPRASELIAKYSQGVPRVVNSICDRVLKAGTDREIRLIVPELIRSVTQQESQGIWNQVQRGFERIFSL